MSRLSDFRLLSFDVYGTLIDWETGVFTGVRPLLNAAQDQNITKRQVLDIYQGLEASQQSKTPEMTYQKLTETLYSQLAARLGLPVPAAEEAKAFGASVGTWPAFGDTIAALKRLSKHYKLVVLSNVDRDSFARTIAGPLQDFPFDLIITAQDVGSYKPDPRKFEYMLQQVKEKFGVEKPCVLQTAQSQFHDHQPARKSGIKSAWISRPGCIMGNRDNAVFDWKFDTLADMADAVENEVAENAGTGAEK